MHSVTIQKNYFDDTSAFTATLRPSLRGEVPAVVLYGENRQDSGTWAENEIQVYK